MALALQLLLVVIEKTENGYSAYSPNLIGVTVAAGTREEVEREVVAAVERRLKESAGKPPMGLGPVLMEGSLEAYLPCRGKTRGGTPCQTVTSFNKNGLCPQHWRMAYGHALSVHNKNSACLLCGESSPWVLDNWDVPCPVKSENPDWPELLGQTMQETRKVIRERKRADAKARPPIRRPLPVPLPPQPAYPGMAPPQQGGVPCAGVRKKGRERGKPCGLPAQKEGLCHSHWKEKYGHTTPRYGHSRSCTACGETGELELRWDQPCRSKARAKE